MISFATVEPDRVNRGEAKGLCRIRHAWYIFSVDMAGHQSSRTRLCKRKNCSASQKQARGYHGGEAGPWANWPRTLWCNHGMNNGPAMLAPEETSPLDKDADRSHIRFGPILGHCMGCGNENILPRA